MSNRIIVGLIAGLSLVVPACSGDDSSDAAQGGGESAAAAVDAGVGQVQIGDETHTFKLLNCTTDTTFSFQGRSDDGSLMLAGSVNASGVGRIQVAGAKSLSATALTADGAPMDLSIDGPRLTGRAGFVAATGDEPQEGRVSVNCEGVPSPLELARKAGLGEDAPAEEPPAEDAPAEDAPTDEPAEEPAEG